jgi:cytochrome oxidase Cu insertion factor (SCO1/SenC/PrrC family)
MLVPARTTAFTVGAFALFAIANVAAAQQGASQAAPVVARPGLKDLAPDFTLRGATRYGLLQTPVRLSDYRGRTVVLAFFYQARTKG